jgi:hypothetical protein
MFKSRSGGKYSESRAQKEDKMIKDGCNSLSYALLTINNADNCSLYSAMFDTTSFPSAPFSVPVLVVSGPKICLNQDQVVSTLSQGP